MVEKEEKAEYKKIVKEKGFEFIFDKAVEIFEKLLDRYEEENPKWFEITGLKLVQGAIFSLKKYIENPEEKDITWDNPFVELRYPVKVDWDTLKPYYFQLTAKDIESPEKVTDILTEGFFNIKQLYVLRTLTNNFILHKEVNKTKEPEEDITALYSKSVPKDDLLMKTFPFPFKGTLSDKKGKKRKYKGTLFVRFNALVIDKDNKEGYYPIYVVIESKGYKPTLWDKEDKRVFWDTFEKGIEEIIPEERYPIRELVPAEKPDFDKVWQKIQTMTTIPVDYDLFKKRELYFPFPAQTELFEEKKLPGGERFQKYKVENIMERMYISFILPPGVDPPKFRKYTMHIFQSMLPFAKAQGTSKPFIKKEHQYILLGKKRGFYSRIDDVLEFLTIAYYDYTNKGTGKKFRRKIGHLVNGVEWIVKGKGAYYQVNINPEVIKTILALSEGKTGKDIPHHISYPIQALTYEPTRETRLIEFLFESVKGFRKPYPRQVKTLLKKMGVTQKEIKTKSLLWLAGELERGLRAIEKQSYTWELAEENPFQRIVRPDTVKQLGFEQVIKELRILKKPKFKKDIFLKWKILIKPPEIPETQKLKLTPEGKNLVGDLLEWHYRPGTNFNIKNPRERTKAQIENTIKTLGVNRVEEIVEEMNRVNPHPKYFWDKVKYYKSRLKIKSL